MPTPPKVLERNWMGGNAQLRETTLLVLLCKFSAAHYQYLTMGPNILDTAVQVYHPHCCHEGAIKHLHHQWEGLTTSDRPAPVPHPPRGSNTSQWAKSATVAGVVILPGGARGCSWTAGGSGGDCCLYRRTGSSGLGWMSSETQNSLNGEFSFCKQVLWHLQRWGLFSSQIQNH